MSYNKYDFCDDTTSADQLFDKYDEERKKIIGIINNNPVDLIDVLWSKNGILSIDKHCKCRMGSGKSFYMCSQCKNLSRIIDFKYETLYNPIVIECGKNAGNKIIVTTYPAPNPQLFFDTESTKKSNFYHKQYDKLVLCGSPIIKKTISGDEFTIGSLIMLMCNKIFKEKKLPHIHMLYSVFVCEKIGYSVFESGEIGNIEKLSEMSKYKHSTNIKKSVVINIPNVSNKIKEHNSKLNAATVKNIVIQLLVIMLELIKINFSHGNPSINSLLFFDEPVSYIYDGFHVKSDVTLKITDMWNSSATFNGHHFSPKKSEFSFYVEKKLFIPEIKTSHETNSSTHYYKLTDETYDLYNSIRNLGFPIYVGSFDFYCFMVSLMSNQSFYNSVVDDELLSFLWKSMWSTTDLESVQNSIKKTHEINPTEIIKGKWLRCDIVNHLWSIVKSRS